jgi:hypothetical protein
VLGSSATLPTSRKFKEAEAPRPPPQGNISQHHVGGGDFKKGKEERGSM